MINRKFYDVLERRSKRLVHLIDISAPPQLISGEIILVIQAAMGYCPEETNKVISDWFSAIIRRDCMTTISRTEIIKLEENCVHELLRRAN